MVNKSYNMNPSKSDEPYFDCTISHTMTPTMVSNFNLPNSNVNKDGPYLKILEQPQTKFRFRYKSEMVGTHGQLKAESSDKNKNVFPTVKLCNWNGGPALIRLMLYTAEDNANERKRHVHELNGKNCNKEGITGGCEVVVDEDNKYTAQFPNLGIIHIAKRDVHNIIFLRKKEELINYTCMNNPGLRTESIQHNIPPTKLQKMKEEAEEEARNMDLNKVVLRFQTFFFDTKANFYRPITEYVDSEVIFNLKNASTGELKIVRISAVSSPCSGGAEVWMLVEKVKKNNVRIKFYELDKEQQEIWKGYGEFKESDVHHQYAIVFRTPAYRSTNIREPVQVKIQLERTTDNDTSEPLDFTFLPENLKRTNAYLDSKVDMEVHPQKRVRHNDIEAMDLKARSNLFLGSREVKQPYSPEAPPFQSPPHMVPSPITPADSPSSVGFYSPPHHGSHNPSITVANTGEDFMLYTSNSEDGMSISMEGRVDHQLGHAPQLGPQYHIVYGGEVGQIPNVEGEQACYQNSFSNQILSPPYYYQAHSPSSNGQGSPQGGNMSPYNQGDISPGHSISSTFSEQNFNNPESDNALSQIQQFDAVQKQLINSKAQVSTSQLWDFSNLIRDPVDQSCHTEEPDLLSMISDSKLFTAPKDFGDIQADCASPQCPKEGSAGGKKDEIDTLTSKLSKVSVNEEGKEVKKETSPVNSTLDGTLSGNELAYRVGITAADCLQSYAKTGNVNLLLATHRYLLAVQNENGENCLHIAINNKNKDVFSKLINASRKMYCSDLLASQNIAGETPLHLAVRANEIDMVKCLLMTPGCNINAVDAEGNTAIHLAAMSPNHKCLSALLTLPINGKGSSPSKSISLYNYEGQTPLHLAANVGCFESVKLLISSGALIHMCERKQGANALHLAVIFGRHSIAKHIIENTSVTVDARLLDGNTALHIAAQSKDKKMCSILIAGKANPYARNDLRKTGNEEATDEEEDEDNEIPDPEEDQNGFTPIDYAEDDAEILTILSGPHQDSQKDDSICTDKHPHQNLSSIDVTANI